MRARWVAAAVVPMAVVAVAWSRAQEAPSPPVPAATAKAGEVVTRLHAEVEILQLDYDADRAFLVDALRELRYEETLNVQGNPNLKQHVAAAVVGSAEGEAARAARDAGAKGQSRTAAAQKVIVDQERRRLEVKRQALDRAKQTFARLSQVLADKRVAYEAALKASGAGGTSSVQAP